MTGERQLLGPLLRDVSRSFYLTLRILPTAIRRQISLAYLLARTTDTIADTKAVPLAQRITLLRQLREGIASGDGSLAPTIQPLASQQTLAAERQLLERLPDCLALLATFGETDRDAVRQLLGIITDGQVFDLERFPGETEAELVALANDEELDRYTYLVAGCGRVLEPGLRDTSLRNGRVEEWKDGRTRRPLREGPPIGQCTTGHPEGPADWPMLFACEPASQAVGGAELFRDRPRLRPLA